MAIEITAAQKQLIIASLQQDKSANHTLLEYYLKSILGKRNVEFSLPGDQKITVPYNQAWEIIHDWAKSNEGGLPVGDRITSTKVGAGRLLAFLQTNIISKSHETGAAYRQLLEQAKHPVPPPRGGSTPQESSFSRSMSFVRQQIADHNNSVLGLSQAVSNSAFIKRFDPKTQELLKLMIAANGDTFRRYTPDMAMRLNSYLIHSPGVENINQVIKVAYSTPADSDLAELTPPGQTRRVGELEELSNQINRYIENTPNYLQDIGAIRQISNLTPTLSDVESLVSSFLPSTTVPDRDALTKALRRAIVESATLNKHLTGKELIDRAFADMGWQAEATSSLSTELSPYLEVIEVKTRAKFIAGDLLKNDSRLLSTRNIAQKIGVESEILWLNPKTLNTISETLVPGSSTNPFLIQQKYDELIQSGDREKAGELKRLIDQVSQYRYYRQEVSKSPLLGLRELIAKSTHLYSNATQPLENLNAKIYGVYERFDHYATWPARTALELWEKVGERLTTSFKLKNGRVVTIPWLDLPMFIHNELTNWQKSIAISSFRNSTRLAQSGRWYAGFFRQAADFSKSFFKADANWQMASFDFIGKKIGNITIKVGKGLVGSLEKIAPGLAAKISSFVGTATSSMGIGLIVLGVQILGKVVGRVFSGLKNILSKIFGGKANDAFGAVPLFLGGVFLALNTALAGIPLILMTAFELIRSAFHVIMDSLISLFILAIIVVAIVLSVVAIIYQGFESTAHLDSGFTQIVSTVICDQSKQNTSNATANVAQCIAEIVNKCPGLNPITIDKLQSSSWQCLVGGLVFKNAITELEHSAAVVDGRIGKGAVQCVGLSAASAADGDGAFSTGQRNACTYASINKPSGYQYLSGCPGMKPGDHFIMGVDNCVGTGGTTVGHIGVVIQPSGGEKFTCVDANYLVPGEIRGPESCYFAKSQISGCLRKM